MIDYVAGREDVVHVVGLHRTLRVNAEGVHFFRATSAGASFCSRRGASRIIGGCRSRRRFDLVVMSAAAHRASDSPDDFSVHRRNDVSAFVFTLATIRTKFLSNPRLSVEHTKNIAFGTR